MKLNSDIINVTTAETLIIVFFCYSYSYNWNKISFVVKQMSESAAVIDSLFLL